MTVPLPTPDGSPQHERRDVDVSSLTFSFIGLIATMILCVIIGIGLHFFFRSHQHRDMKLSSPMADMNREPPLPRLQTTPKKDYLEFAAREKENTTTYSWIDRDQGVVRLPIERAKKIVLEKGLK